MFAPGIPGKHMMQICFVVEDIEEAARNWVRTTGVGPFLVIPHITLEEYNYRGERRASLDFSGALAQSGGIQIELIQQHCDTPSAYRDTIAKGKEGFHHLAVYCDDYDATYQHYMDQGFVASVDGRFGDMRFSYIDTTSTIGCMIELIESNAVQTEIFQRVAEVAENWDGVTDPVRLAFPA
ncbi:MAG: VOC family protein [Novosphingobium sp.]